MPLPAEGVPASTPAVDRLRPLGRLAEVIDGAGKPAAAMVTLFEAPTVKVALVVVMDGAWLTVSVNDLVSLAPMPLLAVTLKVYTPLPAEGVPLRTPAVVRFSPLGRLVEVNDGLG